MLESLACISLALLGFTAATSDEFTTATFADFDWDTVQPSTDLEYHGCYTHYQCARLELPLDWKNESDPRTVAIAIMKLPAAVPDDDPAFGGSVFTNPGGPGNSGVKFVPRISHHLQETIDKPGKKHYEIISFDPRGVGFSTPLADCFHGDTLARGGASIEARGGLGLDSGVESMLYLNALNEANAKRCRQTDASGDSIFEYMSTPSVARDMIEMIEKIEHLRSREAQDQEWLELRKRNEKLPRLQYIGFSYGTVLGNYFAAMYPDRVHRMVLDSVCDVDDYARGPGWLTNIQDMDATFDEFFKGCHEAGPKLCEVARYSDRVWTDVAHRVWSHLAALDEAPRGAVGPNGSSIVIKGRDFRDFIANALYKPILTFKLVAHLLNESINGNDDELVTILAEGGVIPNLEAACPVLDTTDNKTVIHPRDGDALFAVICSDGDDVTDKDMSFWRWYVDRLTSLSKLWGAKWAEVRFPCASWPFKTNWSFKGPFTTPEADPEQVPGRPSAPLLFLSNRFDPVTPVSAARAMAYQHSGAQLVVQESMGHGVIPGAPSDCTDEIVSQYFDTGEVPSDETSCSAECGPWDDVCHIYKASSSVFSTAYIEPKLGDHFPLCV